MSVGQSEGRRQASGRTANLFYQVAGRNRGKGARVRTEEREEPGSAALRGVVGDHAPAVFVAGEDVGGVGAEVGGLSLHHAGDAFNAGDAAEFSLDDHVQVADLELHQCRVLEDAVPALTYIFPADQGRPPGVHAHGPVGVLPDAVHDVDVQVGERVVEPLVGGFDLFDDLRLGLDIHDQPRPARLAQYSQARS
uniref:Uncharacterized protein n=1 Tax=uncultured marine microorganism HF4000_APKG5H11 TaxID=455550 RepID=B3T8K0_9ZZZZ|nr:hypothetical protein ALOHA_HF4000APKG5H11ctg2g27 [uncultured marine microorganism HF4000_APKG5H11]